MEEIKNDSEAIDSLIRGFITQTSINRSVIDRLEKAQVSIKVNEYILYIVFVILGLIIGHLIFK